MSIRRAWVLLAYSLWTSACATNYENTAKEAWSLIASGKPADALPLYEKSVTDSNDELLRLMDEGILLRAAGEYQRSNEKFFKVAQIIDRNGYISAGEQIVTTLTNERQKAYQGEDFEKVLIHLYLGLNFISLGELEEALVETRRVNEILHLMVSKGNRPYELNAFSRYLGGLLFEKEGDDNDAFVAYRNTLKIDPTLSKRWRAIRLDLLRLAKQMGFQEEFESFKSTYGQKDAELAVEQIRERMGSVVLLFESGKSPEKYSSKEKKKTKSAAGDVVDVLLPIAHYRSRPTRIKSAIIEINDKSAKTVVLTDIEATAKQHLKDRMGRQIAKALAAAAVKAGIGVGVGAATKSKELGALVALALMLTSEADTRSWLLLPEKLQMAKIYLKPGTYEGRIRYLDADDAEVSAEDLSNIEVQSFRPTLIHRRVYT